MAPAAAGGGEESGKGTARRDLLLGLQAEAQGRWEAERVFEAAAPAPGSDGGKKFFGNFPYPYMNGLLHLGHAFSLSKLEFASAYHRLRGEHVLFPQGFHCTGMPIKACADKLRGEIDNYGNPPVFPSEGVTPAPTAPAEDTSSDPVDPTKFVAKKSKAQAKKGPGSTQWDILKKSGIPEDEIAAFQDPHHWLQYFPPLAERDMRAMGCGIDWRRSFITTDANPYYDSFVRWQFNKLKALGKVVKDKRYAVYSPKDGQPCADHDRASGEGVGPQDYTLVKMRALELPGALAPLEGRNVFLLAATLRPETMYGQTNAWVLPEGDYGAFEGLDGEVWVVSDRAARNLSFQDRSPEWGVPSKILPLKGSDLLGLPLSSPLAYAYERIHVLPMLTVSLGKGTGVVTSVPSDSADDFMALQDLRKKPKLREKFGIKDEWVLPFEVVPVLEIPGYGPTAAPKVCEDLKIQSQNDRQKLDEAKKLTYLKGFTDGVMSVGEYKGQPVKDVKPKIRDDLLKSKAAVVYSEPEKLVMSRSGDECVVALTDQWYVTYGEEEWQSLTRECLAGMENYGMAETTNSFDHTLGWMQQWACSRSFGLGTRLPWDPQYLVESLSDSTIYMAYYTVVHLLQGGDMYGKQTGGLPAVDPAALTDAVWDAIFLGEATPVDCGVPAETMAQAQREFNFWYPFDLRVSGKDLIQNHLTFCLYNHTALFGRDKWPQGMRCNGHLLLNGDKMSKSTGNFKTLQQAITEYSADAMRFALADAGDGMDDANFVADTANGAILRLTKEIEWLKATLSPDQDSLHGDALRDGPPSTFPDRVFGNAINIAVHRAEAAFDKMLYREALKVGFYELQSSRDTYRLASGEGGLCRDLVLRFVEVQAKLLTPFCPHTCEYIWRDILGKEGLIVNSGFPEADRPDYGLQQAARYLESQVSSVRSAITKALAPPKKKKKGGDQPPAAPKKVVGVKVEVAARFDGWRAVVLQALAEGFDDGARAFRDGIEKEVLAALSSSPETSSQDAKNLKKMAMPFCKFMMQQARDGGASMLNTELPFSEAATIAENAAYMQRVLGVGSVEAVEVAGEAAEATYPGNPNLALLFEELALE